MTKHSPAQIASLVAEGRAEYREKTVRYAVIQEPDGLDVEFLNDDGSVSDKFGHLAQSKDPVTGELIVVMIPKESPLDDFTRNFGRGLRGFLRILNNPLATFIATAAGFPVKLAQIRTTASSLALLPESERASVILRIAGQEKVAMFWDLFRQARADGIISEEEAAALGDLLPHLV